MIKNKFGRFQKIRQRHKYIIQYGLIIAVSAFIYYVPSLLNLIGFTDIKPGDYFKPHLKTPIDSIYFSVVSITTLGFGDINPISQIMRAVVSIEVLLGIVTIGQALHSITVKAEEDKRLPHRLAAYEDVRLLTTRLISYWKDIYLQSVPKKYPASLTELLSQENINKMGMCLDLDAKPSVTPPRTWWQWLPEKVNEMTVMSDKILERHVQVLDPLAYSYIHNLLSDGMLSPMKGSIMNAVRQSDKAMGFPRPTNYGCYLADNEDSLKPIIDLDNWCQKEYSILKNSSNILIKEPFKVPAIESIVDNPASLISQEKLQAQLIKQEEYRARTEA
ncbi:potassium channel family protein [Colwellia sp. BRX10-4]|jgi:hypothetical protein|uniref:potassium channel family protein n=1 Tax=Colwellia sp. BRX10-4 TaxID=2759843 RepID=UPI0015F5D1CC|nr:potassium channel family protein [Colwellia sp. BRX10-4]MBA6399826.1 two pore domain potassium channel family protein [Colwellia sp. BRX10-4]